MYWIAVTAVVWRESVNYSRALNDGKKLTMKAVAYIVCVEGLTNKQEHAAERAGSVH